MRTMFLRIFLWFWLAMAAAAAVLVVSSPLFTRSRPGVERWQRSVESSLERDIASLADALGREGIAAFREEAEDGGPGHPGRLYVFDLKGHTVIGPDAPPHAVALARRAAESGQFQVEREGEFHLAARRASDPHGHELVLVLELRRPPGLVDLLDPRELAPRLIALFVVAGVLCYGLARYLASPVAAVRLATKRLAAGDLSARVGPAVSRRRDEFADLARDIDTMAERVVTLLGSKQRLVRDVSHELRSPLGRLRVALELARKGPEDKTQHALDRIEDEADRLNTMIDQLLTLSRLEEGADESQRVVFDAAAIVAQVVDDAAFEAEARRCTVRLETSGQCEVAGSPGLLRSAVENVLRNAVHYSVEGTAIEVSVGAEGPSASGYAVIRVRDHGPGVPENLLREVFEPFFRVDQARDRSTGGTGLGLAIAARAVARHGGSIEARNAVGGGLEVVISLPVTKSGPRNPAA
ncbi:MAG: ATP-binding protein [Thermoanaerobaculaceae bacterium]|jgi:two-component system sensor histidine kinase CpxA